MKFIVTTFVLLVAGICALPQDEVELDGGQAFIAVTNSCFCSCSCSCHGRYQAGNEMDGSIVDAGYGPLVIPYSSNGIDTPLGWAYAHVEGLECTETSQNKFDRLSFNSVTMRFNLDQVQPRVACVVKSQGAKTASLGRESNPGILQLINTRLEGNVRVSIIDCSFLSTNMESDMKAVWHGRDVVEALNKQIQDNKEEFGRQLCQLTENTM